MICGELTIQKEFTYDFVELVRIPQMNVMFSIWEFKISVEKNKRNAFISHQNRLCEVFHVKCIYSFVGIDFLRYGMCSAKTIGSFAP